MSLTQLSFDVPRSIRLWAGSSALAACALLGASCRTTVAVDRAGRPEPEYVARDTGCHVHDYTDATDVPDGAQSLGWVQVPKEESDEATYEKLRQEICNKGGNALSQLHWLSETGKEAPMVFALEANAWLLPEGVNK